MGSLARLDSLAVKRIWPGVAARIVEGDRITLAIVELEPGAVVPRHQHDNEQHGLVIEGSVTFTVEDETSELGPGGTWRILGGTAHEVVAGDEGAVVVDVFSPPRVDWHDVGGEAHREARWPA